MKREIKFRAWDGKNMMMPEFYDFWIDNGYYGLAWDEATVKHDTPNTEIEKANDWIIMQYTGLKDKNDKEIYEGDIIEDKTHGNLFCEYSDDMQAFVWWRDKVNELGYPMYMQMGKNNIEVIGNIYENKELL